MSGILNLREFIDELRKQREIVDIEYPVDPNLEIAEIHRRVAAADGPALFFHNVKNSAFPVVTNLFGSIKRIEIAFRNRPEALIQELVSLATHTFPPRLGDLWNKRHALKKLLHIGTKTKRSGPVLEQRFSEVNLEALPLLKSWPEDGGHFITLPLVYTEPPQGGPSNLGMYRIHRYDKKTSGLHWQIVKGGGYHYHQAEQRNESLPVTIFLGGPPALMISAIAPLPENIPELILSSLLQGKKLHLVRSSTSSHPLIAECEFALVGEAPPHTRRLEGPFGDHYGYYSWAHEFPVFHCKHIHHRRNAIYPATVVGKPRQEDFYIGIYLQKLLSPLFPLAIPGATSLWSYGETGFHSLSAAIVKERYYRECMTTAFRILGEGQLSLTKFLLVTDQSVDLQDFRQLLTTVLERFQPETDLFIFSNLSLDTLDYTGPALNKGSRGIMLGIGPKVRDLPTQFVGPLPRPLSACAVFSPGCLVVEGPAFKDFQELDLLLENPAFAAWPLIILVDNVQKATKDVTSFLWTTFTRFEPAADIYAHSKRIVRHHLCYAGPIFIDARMKPSYPPEVLPDKHTSALVTKNWRCYFPEGMAMGDSEGAHVY
jgi:4-hydroxybenzoate decarboxylase subunit C